MAQANGAAYLGVSPPLSDDPPKARDNELNDQLVSELKAQNNFESQEETQKRYDAACDDGSAHTDNSLGSKSCKSFRSCWFS